VDAVVNEHTELAMRAIIAVMIDALHAHKREQQLQLFRVTEWISRRETYGCFATADSLRKQVKNARRFLSSSSNGALDSYLESLGRFENLRKEG
jgi:hypothetical protein